MKLDFLKDAIREINAESKNDISFVKKSFIDSLPIKSTNTKTSDSFLNEKNLSETAQNIVKSTSDFGLNTIVSVNVIKPPKPEIDFISVEEDINFGSVDCFYTRIVISFDKNEINNVENIIIMRSPPEKLDIVNKPSFSALADMTSKNYQKVNSSYLNNNIKNVGAENKFSDYLSKNNITTSSQNYTENTNRNFIPESALINISNVDRSVLEDRNFYNKNVSSQKLKLPLSVFKKSGMNVLGGSTVSQNSEIITQVNNSAKFFEIGRIEARNIKLNGNYVEFEFFDPTVVFGAKYSYFAKAINDNGISSLRSKIIEVKILRNKIPKSPSVIYSLFNGNPRFSIICDDPFISHVEIFRKGKLKPDKVTVLNTDENMISSSESIQLDSGFYHIGDIALSTDRSVTFVDRNVMPGNDFKYRFYSVDSFGVKSQKPFECQFSIPDNNIKSIVPPIVTVINKFDHLQLFIYSNDDRIKFYNIEVKNLNKNNYKNPITPDYFDIGQPLTAKRSLSRLGPKINAASNVAWNGIIKSNGFETIFLDRTSKVDNTYQYIVKGIDVFGNETNFSTSNIIRNIKTTLIDSVANLSSTILFANDENIPNGIKLTWQSNIPNSLPNEIIDGSEKNKICYQVEKRKSDEKKWTFLPAVSSTFYIDQNVEPSVFYEYRVISMFSGSFISPYTSVLKINTNQKLQSPRNIKINVTDTLIKPISIILSWEDTQKYADKWIIQRAVCNKIYGSRILSIDANSNELDWENFSVVTRESSRSHGISYQSIDIDKKYFNGSNRVFIDNDVNISNSYFYRIKVLDESSNESEWAYAGIKIVDALHDRKLFSSLSDDDKLKLLYDRRKF